MINIFLSLLFGVCSFQFFFIGIRTSAVNKILVSMPKGIFESSCYVLDTKNPPYFIKDNLERNVLDYVDSCLPNYTKWYRLKFYYYNIESKEICLDEKCRGVEITLRAFISSFYTYKRTMFYEIKGN